MNDAKEVSPASQASPFEPGFEFYSSRAPIHIYFCIRILLFKINNAPVEKERVKCWCW